MTNNLSVFEGEKTVPQRTEQEIMQNWKYMDPPLVSVCSITYNHEPYIRDALDGFLMQETDFPFEVIIHDDASTDRTAEIIREYAAQYPNIIKPIFQTENQYSKNFRIFPIFVFPKAQGEYIALCEGDDYWTDSKKLQTQVFFLVKNKNFILSGHNAIVFNEHLNTKKLVLPKKKEHNFSALELAKGDIHFPTASCVFRNITHALPPEYNMVSNGDTFLFSFLGTFGDAKFHSEINPSCRRQHLGGVYSAITRDQQNDMRMNTTYWLYYYHKKNKNINLSQIFFKKHIKSTLRKVPLNQVLYFSLREVLIQICFIRKIRLVGSNVAKFFYNAFSIYDKHNS